MLIIYSKRLYFPFLESGFWDIVARGIRNPMIWNPEYSLRNPETHKRLESRMQVPLTKIWNPVPVIKNPRLSWIHVKHGELLINIIHSVQYTIK